MQTRANRHLPAIPHHFVGVKKHCYLCFLFLLLIASQTTQAQTQAIFKEVALLPLVPEPPGGLVPFRQGQLWGYADTTGCLRVRPAFSVELPLLIGGLGKFDRQADGSYRLLNARGDYLRVGPADVLVPVGTEALAVRPRAENAGQPYISALPQEFWKDPAEPRRWCNDEGRADPAGRRYQRPHWQLAWQSPAAYPKAYYAGEGLFVARRQTKEPVTAGISDDSALVDRYALVNGQGEPITEFCYNDLELFIQGRALFERAGHVGYLDRRGREVVPPRYADVYQLNYDNRLPSPVPDRYFRGGAVKVFDDSLRTAIIDTTGREVVPLRHWLRLDPPDSAGVSLVHYRTAAGDTVAQFFRADGRPAFRRTFQAAAPFWRNRAVVKSKGQWGLINRRGRLVLPCRYDRLYYASLTHGVGKEPTLTPEELCFFERYGESADTRLLLDLDVLQSECGGKIGFVDARRGREVVPPRYDQVFFSFRNGLAGVVRQGRAFILDRRGRELREAQPYNAFNNGGRAREWQWDQGTYQLLSENGPPSWWLVPDTAWLVVDQHGLPIVPPQPMSHLPLFVTGAGRVGVQTNAGWGLLGLGGQWVIPPTNCHHVEQCDSLVLAFCQQPDSTSTAQLYDPRGRLLRQLPRTTGYHFYQNLKLLLLIQQQSDGGHTMQLLDQAGRSRLTLPYASYGLPWEVPQAASPSQRRHLLRLEDEATPDGHGRLPNGRQGGYISVSGRQFWED